MRYRNALCVSPQVLGLAFLPVLASKQGRDSRVVAGAVSGPQQPDAADGASWWPAAGAWAPRRRSSNVVFSGRDPRKCEQSGVSRMRWTRLMWPAGTRAWHGWVVPMPSQG
jgi:hypothetical protein